jgi:FdhD protein
MPADEPNPNDELVAPVRVGRLDDTGRSERTDLVAVEEPLEIRLGCTIGGRREHRTISVTMRTPGHDRELAAGFLFTEGIVTSPGEIAGVREIDDNVVRVDLGPEVAVDLARLERHFYTASSCGVCGKASIEAIRVAPSSRSVPGCPTIDGDVVRRLPDLLRAAQTGFDRTGGLHASALFDAAGHLHSVREDVGRHNALDKLIGAEFLARRTPLGNAILLVSGRASFELVQKAAVAGIPVLAAVGAPSSLAVELAREHGMTLLGFVRSDRFNIYADAGRLFCRRMGLPTRPAAAGLQSEVEVLPGTK